MNALSTTNALSLLLFFLFLLLLLTALVPLRCLLHILNTAYREGEGREEAGDALRLSASEAQLQVQQECYMFA
jgi:hypothetical protein